VVGEIKRPHGVRGEVRMSIITAYPERLPAFETLYVGPRYTPHRVETMRRHSEAMLIRFVGVSDREGADAFRDQLVYIRLADAVPLEDGEFYLFQLYGITVITDEGETLGTLTDVLETGANDVYVIAGPRGEVLLPVIPEVIKQVDIVGRVMTVHLIEGLCE
jgi:16S rRNA processing protein RimM